MRIRFVLIGSTFKRITTSDRGKLFLVVQCMLGTKAWSVIGYHDCVRMLSNGKQPSDLILLGQAGFSLDRLDIGGGGFVPPIWGGQVQGGNALMGGGHKPYCCCYVIDLTLVIQLLLL